MKIRPYTDPEIASTVIVRGKGEERRYWTGTGWVDGIGGAKRYLRAAAKKKSERMKRTWVLTIGFRH